MQQNYSQKFEMQIQKENYHDETFMIPSQKESLKEFLKNNFEFPSNNLLEIKKFISKDSGLEKMINRLPEIISKEITFTDIFIDFMKETDPKEKILEITIFSKENEEIVLEKEDKISDNLIDNYNPDREYIILVEHHVEK